MENTEIFLRKKNLVSGFSQNSDHFFGPFRALNFDVCKVCSLARIRRIALRCTPAVP